MFNPFKRSSKNICQHTWSNWKIVSKDIRRNWVTDILGLNGLGYYWHELSNRDRNFFIQIPVSVAEIREGASRENIINQFIRLNSFGKVMDKSHLDLVKNMLKGSENA